MANILYISYDGMTDSLGQSQVIPYLIGLTKKGHKIDILSTEKPKIFKQKKYKISELLKENNIEWNFIYYRKNPPVISTISDINDLWKKAKKLNKKKKYDIVHCRSYISALVGVRMKREFSTKFVFDMRGFYADERVDGKIWNLKNPIFKWVYNFFKGSEVEFLEESDLTISLTNNAKNKILQWKHINTKNIDIEVIPCCADMQRFDPNIIAKEDISKLKQNLDIKQNDFVLTYLGSIGTWYMLDEMLDFYKVLLNKIPNSKFLFITAESSEFILSKAKEKNISADKFIIKQVDYTEVPLYLSVSNYALFFILPVFSKSASSPIKQGEIMSMGIPIVCNSGVGDTDFVINNYNCGILVENFNNKDYEKAIDKMLNTNLEADKIRDAAKDFYSLEKGINLYNKVYTNVLGK